MEFTLRSPNTHQHWKAEHGILQINSMSGRQIKRCTALGVKEFAASNRHHSSLSPKTYPTSRLYSLKTRFILSTKSTDSNVSSVLASSR